MKWKTWCTSQIASCSDCDWECEWHENYIARKEANKHAEETGHCSHVETALVTSYNLKE
jgi:hypothetical protein